MQARWTLLAAFPASLLVAAPLRAQRRQEDAGSGMAAVAGTTGPCRERTMPLRGIVPWSQINTSNASRLEPVWSFSTGVLGGHEGQPLVVDNTMYVVTPYPDVLYAFDLTKDGYPLKWKYRPASESCMRSAPHAVTRSTAVPYTPTARSSTTCSTGTP